METKIIQDYLSQVLACDVSFYPEELSMLPFFVRRAFLFYSGELFSKKVYFLCAKDNFFEKRVTNYALSGVGKTVEEQSFALDADF